MSKREKIHFRVSEDGLILADNYARSLFAAKKYTLGQIVRADITKLRTKGLNKHAHNIGTMCITHIDDFKYLEGRAHAAIKRLQLESGAECEQIEIRIAGIAEKITVNQAKSLSYDNLGEEDFKEALKVICRHISEVYWPNLTPEEVEEMAKKSVDE